jgi:hypothetical protein
MDSYYMLLLQQSETYLTLLMSFAPSQTDASCWGGMTVMFCDNVDGRILHSSFFNLSKDTTQMTKGLLVTPKEHILYNQEQGTPPDKPGRQAEPPHSTTVLYHPDSS